MVIFYESKLCIIIEKDVLGLDVRDFSVLKVKDTMNVDISVLDDKIHLDVRLNEYDGWKATPFEELNLNKIKNSDFVFGKGK